MAQLISQQLRFWMNEFSEIDFNKVKVWDKVYWTKVTSRDRVLFPMALIVYLLSVVDLVMARGLHALRVPLRVAVGAHSCITASFMFLFCQEPCWRALGGLLEVAEALERTPCSDPVIRHSLQKRADRARRMTHFFLVHAMSVASGVAISLVFLGRDSFTMEALHHVFPGLSWAILVWKLVPITNGILTYARTFAFLNATYLCSSALFEGLGLEFRALHPYAESRRELYRLHGLLLHSVHRLDATLRGLMAHLLLALLTLPAISTLELLVLWSEGGVDLPALIALPSVVVFTLLALSAQAQADASEALAWHCYEGAWLLEGPRSRRARFLAITLAAKRPAFASVSGLGALTRPACLETLRKWFSLVQVLFNLTR